MYSGASGQRAVAAEVESLPDESSSSGEHAPGGLGFLSTATGSMSPLRAQCRVELVCSPRRLEADVKTVEQMRLVNALCRFVELAEVAC
jgi:hypothetical protein